ncbi:MAG: geranylgeranyl reductase family protein [Fibrobacterota bacterium]
MENYDIAVIGAGPAGLSALREMIVAAPGVRTCVLEKNRSYEEVIRCGEGVWKRAVEQHFPLRPEWIRCEIHRARFFSGDGTGLLFEDPAHTLGYILNRSRMQEDILQELQLHAGLTLKRGYAVRKVEPSSQGQVLSTDEGTITASVVIDASGPLSRLGNAYGITPLRHRRDVGCYTILQNTETDPGEVRLYRDTALAPEGYIWSFPCGDNCVNVGIASAPHPKGAAVQNRLREAVARLYPGRTPDRIFGGVIPCYRGRRRRAAAGFIQCGDAADTVNPLMRSGISEAMLSGKIAARAALRMHEAGIKKMRKNARWYSNRLHKTHGRKMNRAVKARRGFYEIAEQHFNTSVRSLARSGRETFGMREIIKAAVSSHPTVFWSMRHFL